MAERPAGVDVIKREGLSAGAGGREIGVAMSCRPGDERGAVLIVVTLIMTVMLLLTAGGIGGAVLYSGQRELQKAADQAAVAGAAALPPLNPSVLYDSLPFPISGTDPVFEIAADRGLDLPRLAELIPDPRSVACAYGSYNLSGHRPARMIDAFGAPLQSPPPTVCQDVRIHPSMLSSPLYTCLDDLAATLTSRLRILETDLLLRPLVPDVISAVLAPVNRAIAALEQLVPAALSPRMQVVVASGILPPLLSLVTGQNGLEMGVSATAERRLKNAVMVPLVPGGQVGPVVTNEVNLNPALAQPQPALIDALAEVDEQLNILTSQLSLPGCQNLLAGIRQDLSDIYDPPSGYAPSATDLVAASVAAAESAAAEVGVAVADLAGEAYYVIGAGGPVGTIGSITTGVVGSLLATTALTLLGPIQATQIPTLDVALVVFTDLGEQNYRGAVVSAANARGLFRAVLID